jgi:uncharacterized protein YggE
MAKGILQSGSMAACYLAVALSLLAGIASAGADDGISVNGVGVARGTPSVVEISARVVGEGELAADASAKFNAARKKGLEALEALKIPDFSVEPAGPSIGFAPDPLQQMRMLQGMAGDSSKQKVQMSEQLRLKINGADKIDRETLVSWVIKIIDVAKEAGLQVGPLPSNYLQAQIRAQTETLGDTIVVFKIPNKSRLEAQAYEKALDDARAKAEHLAELAGVKLGRVLSVQDESVAAAANSPQSMIAMIYGNASASATASGSKEAENSSLGEIPVTVHVTVKFEIRLP